VILGSQLLLIGAVAAVGVLHTVVPDHWVPITVIAQRRGWSKSETARAALQAGTGHVLSTLVIAVVVWIAGAAAAKRFGAVVDTVSSVALISFGLWIAVSAWHEQNHHRAHPRQQGSEQDVHVHGSKPESGHNAIHERKSRVALLLILGSSPMVEGVPAFFAAGKYGVGLIVVMAAVFAACTIGTYVLLCISSTVGFRHLSFGALERYGEILSGAVIAMVGLAFWLWPIR